MANSANRVSGEHPRRSNVRISSAAIFRLNGIVDCPERERLAGAVTEALMRIIEIALRQHMAVKTSTFEARVIDQELAEAVGEKERRLGALAEHEREHGCTSGPSGHGADQ